MGISQRLRSFIDTIEQMSVLDRTGNSLGKAVRNLVPPGAPRDALSGTWLGHALHPPLTDVVIGSYLGAAVLDVLRPDSPGASERLLQVGVVAAVPTAATGAADWAYSEISDPRVRRVGLIHAAANLSALALASGSLLARRRGSLGSGRALSAAASGVLAVGGFLGGHLSYTRGVGPNQTAYDPGPRDWTPVAEAAALHVGDLTVAMAGDTPVLLVRDRDGVHALHNRCSHRGCSLQEGELEDHVITCGCHGSQFDVRDGSLVRGPATAEQPAFDVREDNGRIMIRLAAAT